MDRSRLDQLPAPLLDWYESQRRILPWREEPTPYRVWISEIMLQQTRVEAVLPYYERFLAALPSVQTLAQAKEELLLKLWEGLGYYSRVRNLQKAARLMVEQHGAAVPGSYEELLALPGIGEYTAGAICSIAFALPEPAVDGNVLRICSRICGDSSNMASAAVKKQYREALRPLYQGVKAGDLTQALMELGATVCLPNGAPLCHCCPAAPFCLAHQLGQELDYPVKAPKKPRKVEQRSVWLLRKGEEVLLHRRPDKGLLAGLWELPNTLEGEALPFPVENPKDCGKAKHIFSHIEWHMQGKTAEISREIPLPEDWRWVPLSDLRESIALPSAFSAFAEKL